MCLLFAGGSFGSPNRRSFPPPCVERGGVRGRVCLVAVEFSSLLSFLQVTVTLAHRRAAARQHGTAVARRPVSTLFLLLVFVSFLMSAKNRYFVCLEVSMHVTGASCFGACSLVFVGVMHVSILTAYIHIHTYHMVQQCSFFGTCSRCFRLVFLAVRASCFVVVTTQ